MRDELEIVLFTLKVASLSTLIIAPFALGLAMMTRLMNRRLRTILESISMLPLILPPTAVGFVLLDLFSRASPLGQLLDRAGIAVLFTPAAAVIAAGVMAFPLMFRAFRTAIETADFRYFDLARTLGSTPSSAFRRVILPLSWQGLLSGTLLAFCRALGEFGATILIAGSIPGRTQTLALAIYDHVQGGRTSDARILLLFVVVIAFTAIATSEVLMRRQQERLAR